MKELIRVLFLFFVLSLVSCGEDACTQENWIGTYTGTIICDGNSEEVTVMITASGNESVVIRYESATISTEYSALPIMECALSASSSAGGLNVNITSTLDGNDLVINEIISVDGGSTDTCNIVASK